MEEVSVLLRLKEINTNFLGTFQLRRSPRVVIAKQRELKLHVLSFSNAYKSLKNHQNFCIEK